MIPEERACDDRGAAMVLALALVHLLLLIALVGAVLGSLAVTRSRAGAVADMAALAAAESWGDPCADAGAVAAANGMATAECRLEGGDVVVEVTAPMPAIVSRWLAVLGHAAESVRVTARAGPPAT